MPEKEQGDSTRLADLLYLAGRYSDNGHTLDPYRAGTIVDALGVVAFGITSLAEAVEKLASAVEGRGGEQRAARPL